MTMRHWLELSHHRHSGRLRPHEYTSYAPLFALLLVAGLALGVCSASAAGIHPGPQSGSVGLTGEMPGKPPTTAATITAPAAQQHISASPVTVSGTCPAKTLVQIYKNDIFAGSTACSDSGTFSLQADLLIGQNTLIARVYDDLNQPGPDSAPVIVFYDALPSQAAGFTSLNFGTATQLLLNTDAVYRGIFPSHEFAMPITIIGGAPPYAVNVQWGDSTNKIVPRNDNVTFSVVHSYAKPGVYPITLQATDSQGRVAFLTVASIVNGQPPAAAAATAPQTASKLWALWPLYTGSVAVVISFWLGERREKHVLSSRGPVYTSTS